MQRTIRVALPLALGTLIVLGWLVLPKPGEVVGAAPMSTGKDSLSEPIESSQVISDALGYVKTQQQPDGGVAGFGLESDPDSTARAVLALAAAGRPMSWMTSISGTTMVEYLEVQAVTYTHDTSGTLFPGRAGILLSAVSAANEDPFSFGAMDIISELEATLDLATGAYSTTASAGWSTGEASDLSQAWVILGLSAAARPVPDIASGYLVNTQAGDGSWGFGDLDTTALAVSALLGSGNLHPQDDTIQNALGYFRETQLANGGWRPVWDADPLNADSTGWILHALRASGYTYPSISWAGEGSDPITALVSLQKTDGSIGGTFANAYSTVEAIYGLTGEVLYNLGEKARGLRALTWLNDLQNADGSWSAPFGHPAGATADAVLSYAVAGFDPHSVKAPYVVTSTSAMDYLEATASEYAEIGPDTAGKLALTVVAAGDDPQNFGGVDILQEINKHFDPLEGGYGVITNTWHQSYAILGLQAAGVEAPSEAVDKLVGLQQTDGGWKYDFGPWNPASDPDSTALAMQALISTGILPLSSTIQAAVDFLHGARDSLGGWNNANSTAFAIQGLLSAGIDLTGEDWLVDGRTPFSALAAYQKVDGPFYFDHGDLRIDNAYATRQAVPPLLGVYYPFSPTGLNPFIRIQSGADPDRAVISRLSYNWGNSVAVTVPIGSDVNQDTVLTLDWRQRGAEEWITGTLVQRKQGYFSATLPVTQPLFYELRLIFADDEGVQFEGTVSETLTLMELVAPNPIYLPLVKK